MHSRRQMVLMQEGHEQPCRDIQLVCQPADVRCPLHDVTAPIQVDQVVCGQMIRLHLMLRPVIPVPQRGVCQLVSQRAPVMHSPHPRPDHDQVVIR